MPPTALPWLLERDDPGARYLALRDLAGAPADSAELRAARRAAHRQGPIAAVLAAMEPEGYWVKPGPGYNPKYRSTVWALILLAQLGASCDEDQRVAAACAYLLDHLCPGGQFTTQSGGSPAGTVDCLQGNLCWALLELGCDDPRLAGAFEWMARTVTGEGLAPASDRSAPLRYYGYKCGPNFACSANGRQPCAWGGVKVMLAFGRLPAAQRTPLIKRAIRQGAEWLLAGDPAAAGYPNGRSSERDLPPGDRRFEPLTRPNRAWWKFGFPVFYVTDLLQNVEALVALGHAADPRLAPALALIRAKADAQGRWPLEYDYAGKTWLDAGKKGAPSKWVTVRALRVLQNAGA